MPSELSHWLLLIVVIGKQMATPQCKPPNKLCGSICIPPTKECGGKDTKVSPENGDKLKKLGNAAKKAQKKKEEPEKEKPSIEDREFDLKKRQLDFDEKTRGLKDKELSPLQVLEKQKLGSQKRDLDLERRRNKLNEEEETRKNPKPKTPEQTKSLADAIQEALGSTQGLLAETEQLVGIEGISGLSSAGVETLRQLTETLRKEDNK